jgi:integrase
VTTRNDHRPKPELASPHLLPLITAVITWTKAAENIVRHPSGTYYLRAKIDGKNVRKSLGTSDLRIAKKKRDARLEELRRPVVDPDMITILSQALQATEDQTMQRPKLKQKTIRYYGQLFAKIRTTLPLDLPVRQWTTDAARAWWKAHCDATTATHANNALQVIRRMGTLLASRGHIATDPSAALRRLKIQPARIDDMPTLEQMDAIIGSIRSQGLRCSEESANFVEFLAWSGLRISEAQAVRWEDVGAEWLTVTGGAGGTKNGQIRQIPLNNRLSAVLAQIQHEGAKGPIFHILTPRMALQAACKRLGIRHMRIHDLRHWLATHAITQGVDVVTLASWLGHKDGGKTLLATYAHHQKLHSLASAKKLT